MPARVLPGRGAPAMPAEPEAMAPAALQSFISGLGEKAQPEDLAQLRIGAVLRLRRAPRPSRGCTLEIIAPSGRSLGWLPREEEEALGPLADRVETIDVRVTGIVPAFQRPRVQIGLLLPAGATPEPATRVA